MWQSHCRKWKKKKFYFDNCGNCVAYFADRYTKACAEVTADEHITAYAKNKFNKWEKKAPKHSGIVFNHEDGLFEVRTPINPNSAYRGNHRHQVNMTRECDSIIGNAIATINLSQIFLN